MICPNCGQENRPGAKFCDECGIVLPASATARQTTAPPRATYAPQAQRPAARRMAAADQSAPTAETGEETRADDQPSGTTMLDKMRQSDDGRARRTFALIAGLLVLSLCVCCAAAAVALYALTQNPS